MLNFLGSSTTGCHYYYFKDANGELYYWKSNKSEVYNTCFDCGRIKGIAVLDYEIKKNGKRLFHNGKWFEEISVNKYERCA